ncbi:DUF6339 family protein [Bacillus thermotolerans]|uniref:DUF6339 family protein n=1 Tax=Bacillus thermotolerans TaxID=1221996 RepID=UPI00058965BE|nr:DUF6339 family protein [Bacillus thermotolerans]KKB42080.1 hypothetical protein QY96_01554 [Bacillus thermotolerans]
MNYLTNAALLQLKTDIHNNANQYLSDEQWYMAGEDLQLDFPIVELDKDVSDKTKNDLTNAKILYEAMKDLPLSLASQENFWVLLTHTAYWDYMRKRWPYDPENPSGLNFINTYYFFGDKNFYRNGLSRLWWIAYLTYDADKENPYHYTEILFNLKDLDAMNQIIETTRLSRNKTALRATLSVLGKLFRLNEANEIKLKNKRKFIRSLMKHINFVGAVTIWDSLSQSDAEELIWEFAEQELEIDRQPTF